MVARRGQRGAPREAQGGPIGSQTIRVPLTLPGHLGLNTQEEQAVLGPEWATRLINTVLDDSNRVASRLGFTRQTAVGSELSSQIVQLAQFRNHQGTEFLVATTASGLHLSDDNGATFTDRTGTLTPGGGNWQFDMFGDDIIGAQEGEKLIKSSGTNFEEITGTHVPSGNALLSAFGRVWAVDSDGTTIRYSNLRNVDVWDVDDFIDMRNVWHGTDTVVALAEFNGAMVVFGRRNIVVWDDGQGTALGMDPFSMFVVDTLNGVGCVARDTVLGVEGDLWFLSDVGLMSLGRLLQQRSNPVRNLSQNVQDDIRERVKLTASSEIRAAYSPENNFYILSFPLPAGGVAFVFDPRARFEDGTVRVAGTWRGLVPTALARLEDGNIYMARTPSEGVVGTYEGLLDDGDEFQFHYRSGWLRTLPPELEGRLQILKRLSGVFFATEEKNIVFEWAWDFSQTFNTALVNLAASGDVAEWGEAEWGEEEWGAGVDVTDTDIPGRGSGTIIKLGIRSAPGSGLSLQQLATYVRLGRLV